MTDTTPGSPPPQPMPVDIDLYCLECGYNLRGLSGDPRRCPECGHENPMGDLELPEPLVQQELQRMQTAPTVCMAVVLFLGLLVWGCLLAMAGWGLRLNTSPSRESSPTPQVSRFAGAIGRRGDEWSPCNGTRPSGSPENGCGGGYATAAAGRSSRNGRRDAATCPGRGGGVVWRA